MGNERPDDLVVSVEPRNDTGASAKADRAASLRPLPATQSSRSGIPSAEWRDKSGCQYCDGYCHGGCRQGGGE